MYAELKLVASQMYPMMVKVGVVNFDAGQESASIEVSVPVGAHGTLSVSLRLLQESLYDPSARPQSDFFE